MRIDQTCEWCGHDHLQSALCSKRPTWSRRGFLALLGAAAVGIAADPLCLTGTGPFAGIDLATGPDFTALVLVSDELIRDSAVNMGPFIKAALVQAIERVESEFERELIYGKPFGITPRGFLKAS